MATISPRLLELLRCPATGKPLVQRGDELVPAGEPAGIRYAVRDGIPVLLRPAAGHSNPQE